MAGGREATGGLDLGAIKVCRPCCTLHDPCSSHAPGPAPCSPANPLHTLATACPVMAAHGVVLHNKPLVWHQLPTTWRLFDPCCLWSNRPCAVQEATAKLKETAQQLKTERELRAANLNPQRPSECSARYTQHV